MGKRVCSDCAKAPEFGYRPWPADGRDGLCWGCRQYRRLQRKADLFGRQSTTGGAFGPAFYNASGVRDFVAYYRAPRSLRPSARWRARTKNRRPWG